MDNAALREIEFQPRRARIRPIGHSNRSVTFRIEIWLTGRYSPQRSSPDSGLLFKKHQLFERRMNKLSRRGEFWFRTSVSRRAGAREIGDGTSRLMSVEAPHYDRLRPVGDRREGMRNDGSCERRLLAASGIPLDPGMILHVFVAGRGEFNDEVVVRKSSANQIPIMLSPLFGSRTRVPMKMISSPAAPA